MCNNTLNGKITKQITFPNTRLRYLNMFLLLNKCTDGQFCYYNVFKHKILPR